MTKRKTRATDVVTEETRATDVVTEETQATVAHVMQAERVVRTYTKAENGDDFLTDAQTFCSTRDDSYSVVTE
jgi:hypothetical protein